MTIQDVVKILEGELICGQESRNEPVRAFAGSDLLSDILHFEKDDYALLTSLANSQVIRTAEITNACCVVILRGKNPQPEALALARMSDIPVILSPCSMFDACGRLAAQNEREEKK